MAPDTNQPDLSQMIRKYAPKSEAPVTQPENELDSLLVQHANRRQAVESKVALDEPPSPIDKLRQSVEREYIPMANELCLKYEPQGVTLTLDASRFLGGGREISITIEFSGSCIRLDGVVMPTSIAFNLTRFGKDIPGGVTGSGPTLRGNALRPEQFRQFICDQMAHLVQSVLRKK